jgi:hypothetical protein
LTLAERETRVGASAWPSVADFVISCVPAIGPRTLALCRILLGLGFLYFWLQYDPDALARLSAARRPLPFTDLVNVAGWLTAWSAHATLRAWLYWSVAALAVLFAVGAFVRIVAPLFALCLWLAAMLMQFGHFITPLLLGMTVTAFAPWSAAWSVDALRRGAAPESASPLYGYAPWLLGLCIGLAYASAGLSKLWLTGGGWLWDTGARNGFIQDLGIALTDMGIWLTNHYWLALAASIFSSFGQIAYLFACFTRSERVKYAICFGIALPFLVGLVLTMGLFWWPWGLLILILYTPWRWIDRSRIRSAEFPPTPAGRHHRTILLASTLLLVGAHAYVVSIGREFEPLISNYPMYADRMRARGVDEAKVMHSLTSQNRNVRRTVHLVLDDGTERDVTGRHTLGWFLWQARLYKSSYALIGRETHACRVAAEIEPRAVAIRHRLHRFRVANGELVWGDTELVRTQDCSGRVPR